MTIKCKRKILKLSAIFAVPNIAFLAFLFWSIAPVATDAQPISSTKILARDGSLLYEVARPSEGLRTAVSLDRVPQSLQNALIAIEDKRFFSHTGVDRLALLRATYQFVTRGHAVSGASTIEMQLMKNLFFADAPRSPFEKLREMVAAEFWSLTHAKSQTLETYLNTIPLGNGTNGVEAASQKYFRKDIGDLTLGESALLVGMMNAPSRYDPYAHRSASLARRDVVLARMKSAGMIDASEEIEAPVLWTPRHEIHAPHFVERVLGELEKTIPDIRTGGYMVKTTLDPNLQATAEQIIDHRLQSLASKNVTDAAAIMIDPHSGDILAYVGSADYWNADIGGQIDMVAAKRQPGSALKPFLVFDALRGTTTPATVIADLPTRFDTSSGDSYYPRNFNTKYNGPVTVRDALGSSLNIPMVKLLDQEGLQPFFNSLRLFGITFPEHPEFYGDAIILGGGETSLHDVARGYARLALYGRNVDTRDVSEVRDESGKIIFSEPESSHAPMFSDDVHRSDQAGALLANILSDNSARALAFGEANLLDTGKRIAVKSGTTKDFRDNLAFGYSPDLVVGVWVGNTDDSPMEAVTGVTGSVPILHDILQSQYANKAPVHWPDPGGLITKQICLPSGKLATPECPKQRLETFIEGTEPKEVDDWWKKISGKLTLVPPSEYTEWARRSRYLTPNAAQEILSPLDGDAYVIDDRLSLDLQSILFTATSTGAKWKLNGKNLQSDGNSFIWKPVRGEYELQLTGTDQIIHFSVR